MINSLPGAAPELILASGSRYRAELLARLRLPFAQQSPEIDESALPGEVPSALARRLALTKAQALRTRQPQAWILGSDQVAALGRHPIGKPGSRAQAVAQLAAASGRSVTFHTGVALLTPAHSLTAVDITRVCFRRLDAAQIERYVDAEPALDCAGSFKCEGYGISLFERIDSHDPTALIGLPLIAVCSLLRQAGYPLP